MDREAKPVKVTARARAAAARPSRARKGADGDSADRRLADALAQQAATAEILRVMAASTSDVQPVLDAVAAQAARLCRAPFAYVLMRDGDAMRTLAHYSADDDITMHHPVVPLRRTTINGRAVLDRTTIHHADVVPLLDGEYPDARGPAQDVKYRAVLAVPLMRDEEAHGAIFLWRRETGLFTPDQVALVETFAAQAAIAIENVRLFHATHEALEQQRATSEILRTISRSQTDVQPVFEIIAENALRLCDATFSGIYSFDGEFIRIGAMRNLDQVGTDAFHTAYPCRPNRGGATQRAVLTREVVHIPDIGSDAEYAYQDVANAAHFRSVLSTPLLREGQPIGTITAYRDVAAPFPDSQIALLKTFADQAVIAIENVRLFTELEARNRDLAVALDQQTATTEILRVISGSNTDAQPVFDTIVRSVRALCSAAFSGVYLVDGAMLALVAADGMSPDELAEFSKGYPRPLGPDTVSGRAALECRVVQTPDLGADPDYRRAPGTRVGARTVLGVPLIRDGQAIGSIGVWHSQIKPFSGTQIELLQTFADQAVIAIENVRLFTELGDRNRDLTEALEQQTATSEILRVISQSQTDVQPVFESIASAALELCRASSANVFTFDGELVHLAASVNANPKYADELRRLFPRPLGRDTAVTRAMQTRGVVILPDVLEDSDYRITASSLAGGFRSVLSVPLMREGVVVGGIALGKPEPGPFADTHVALIRTFADQAVIAIENVRLFGEVEARTAQLAQSVDELKALGEVGQAVSSTLDLPTVLSTIVTRATELTGMDGGAIYEYDDVSGAFHLHTADGLSDEAVELLRSAPIRSGEGALGRLAISAEPVQILDILDESAYQSRVREILIRQGYRSLLAVPLLREDKLLGGLVVNRSSAGEFDTRTITLLQTFATQSALAIQNARLFREIEATSRELETASRHKSEFLANMSHELRTPLNAIIGFSEVLAERMFGELNDKQSEYVTDIVESGRHLLALINDILDLSKIEAGRLELDISEFAIAPVVDATLSLVRERAQRRGIALHCAVDPGLNTLHADERKLRQVLLNLLTNAIKFTPEGGSIDVRATGHPDRVEFSVADTGVGIAPEDQAAVFEEFRQVGTMSKKIEGTGLGLAISRKFVELHGGRIWLDSKVGRGSTFSFSLPIRN